MIKKIVCIFVCTLLFATVLTVARPINKEINEDPVSTGLAKDVDPITYGPVNRPLPLFYDPAKAFMAYDPTGNLDAGPCEFNLDAPDAITSLAAWAPGSNGFCSGAAWTLDGKLYMCDYSTSNSVIYEVDPITGDHTQIGSSTKSLHAMTYDITTGIMYAAGGSSNANSLYTIDQTTGAATLVGAFGGTLAYMLMLACDGTGLMYGIDIQTASLYSINKATGTATSIGATGQAFNYAQDMCYDIDNNILYVAGYTATGTLFTCNVETGACTPVGQFQNGCEIDAFAIPYITNMPPDTPAAPTGPDSGIMNVEYTFTATASDPESEQIYYMFNWGDGTDSGWVGPYNSGLSGSAIHKWTAAGDYPVKVKAKDVNDAESGFSPSHTIAIAEPPVIEVSTPKGGLFRVTAIIKNTGNSDATGVSWSIVLNGGLIILGKTTSGTIDIPKNGQKTVQSDMILGIGKTLITVSASIPASSDAKSKNAFVIGFLII
jgi:hypothetical protein